MKKREKEKEIKEEEENVAVISICGKSNLMRYRLQIRSVYF